MKDEKYTPEQILQAGFIALQEDGKIYLDSLIMKLKEMYGIKSRGKQE